MNEPRPESAHEREGRLFEALLEIPAGRRSAFLDRECAGDPALRARLEGLLAADGAAGHLLEDGVRTRLLGETAVGADLPAAEGAGMWVGRYKLLELLGEGGFGVVWMAEQSEPVRRRVALKILKPGMDTATVVARFEAERQALALMDHPNIARVFDAGTSASGRPFVVMELVRGTRITQFCDHQALPTMERLKLFIQVCLAVQHAHQKGIIHRDLKPSNILVALHDGVPVPKVIDFGIAKATLQPLTDKTLFTQFQQFLGTPAYMSPEQAEMSGLDLDTRSDIYSLGVLLYELLTGTPPFDTRTLLAAGFDEMRRIIRESTPPRPSTRLSTLAAGALEGVARQRGEPPTRLTSAVRGDLDWIVMKCLEKDRTRRYETANGLAKDLERHLQHEPVTARPPSAAYRAEVFVRRHRIGVATVLAVLLALLGGIVVSAWQAAAARRARQEALWNLYVANVNVVQHDYEQGMLARVTRFLEDTAGDPRRGFEWYYWQRRIHGELRAFRGHTDAVRGVALSPDGRLGATAAMDGLAKVWDLADGREVAALATAREARSVAFSPDGRRLAVAGDDGVGLWEVGTYRKLVSLGGTNDLVNVVRFSEDGRRLVSTDWSGNLRVWDVETDVPVPVWRFEAHEMVPTLAVSPDGQWVLTGSVSGTNRMFGLADGALQREWFTGAGAVWGAGFSPDSRQVVTAHAGDYCARVWEVESGRLKLVLKGHRDVLWAALFSPDGRRIYTAGWDAQIKIWEAATGVELGALPKGHRLGIVALALSPDGRRLLSGSWDGDAKLWNADRLDEPLIFRPPGIAFPLRVFLEGSSTRGFAMAGSPDSTVSVLDFPSGRERVRLRGHTDRITALGASIDRRRLLSGSADGTARVWDADSGRERFVLGSYAAAVTTIDASPGDRWFVTGCEDGRVRIWDGRDGSLAKEWKFGVGITTVAVAPAGDRVAVQGPDKLAVCDLPSGRPLWVWSGPNGPVTVAWSRDGRRLATGNWGTDVTLWDAASGSVLQEFHGHTLPAEAVGFSPDEERLVTGAQDRTVRVWDMRSGRELLILRGHDDAVTGVQFTPDGRGIITTSVDLTARLWEAASAEEAAAWRPPPRLGTHGRGKVSRGGSLEGPGSE